MNAGRRRFLAAGSTLGAIAFIAGVAAWDLGSASNRRLLLRVLAALNHAHLAVPDVADEARVQRLLGRVLQVSPDRLDECSALTVAQLKARIGANIASNYRQRQIRVVDGWWLSETEAAAVELTATFEA